MSDRTKALTFSAGRELLVPQDGCGGRTSGGGAGRGRGRRTSGLSPFPGQRAVLAVPRQTVGRRAAMAIIVVGRVQTLAAVAARIRRAMVPVDLEKKKQIRYVRPTRETTRNAILGLLSHLAVFAGIAERAYAGVQLGRSSRDGAHAFAAVFAGIQRGSVVAGVDLRPTVAAFNVRQKSLISSRRERYLRHASPLARALDACFLLIDFTCKTDRTDARVRSDQIDTSAAVETFQIRPDSAIVYVHGATARCRCVEIARTITYSPTFTTYAFGGITTGFTRNGVRTARDMIMLLLLLLPLAFVHV